MLGFSLAHEDLLTDVQERVAVAIPALNLAGHVAYLVKGDLEVVDEVRLLLVEAVQFINIELVYLFALGFLNLDLHQKLIYLLLREFDSMLEGGYDFS